MATKDIYAQSIVDRKKDIRAQFSANVKILLEERHMTQAKLCREVSKEFERNSVLKNADAPADGTRIMQPWEISRWVKGEITPDPEAIAAIAAVLGVKPDEIVHGITSETDPNAIVFSSKQIDSGYFWEFKGTVNQETHRKLLSVLAEAA